MAIRSNDRACGVIATATAFAHLLMLAPLTAHADTAEDIAAARALGTEGVMLADASKCAQAIEKLDKAERLHHAPTTADRLGECEIEVGKIVAGTERLQRVVREPLGDNPPPAFIAAVARAQKALTAALPKIASLRISITAPPEVKFVVTVDGVAISDAMIDSARPTDPGTHKVRVTAPRFLPSEVDVTLNDGESKSTTLELKADPNAPIDVAPEDPSTTKVSSSKTGAYVAITIGATGIVVGAIAGLVVANKASSLSSNCDSNKVCPAGSDSDISSAKRWGAVSTIGFVVGAVGLGTGIVLLLAGKSTEPAPPMKAHVAPTVGVGFVGFEGSF